MKFSKIMADKAQPEMDNQEETEEDSTGEEDYDDDGQENSEQEQDADASDATDEDVLDEQQNEPDQSEKNKAELKPKSLPVIGAKPNVSDNEPKSSKVDAEKAIVKSSKSGKPNTQEMVESAIKMLNEFHGSSLVAIKRYITSTYSITTTMSRLDLNLKKYIKNAIASGRLIQVKRSFKLSPQAKKEDQQKEKEKRTTEKKKLKEKTKRLNAEKGGKVKKPKQGLESKEPKKTKSTTKVDKIKQNKENKPTAQKVPKSSKATPKLDEDIQAKKSAAAPLKDHNVKMKVPGKLNAVAENAKSPDKKTEKAKAEKKPVITVRKSIATLIIPPKPAGKKAGKKVGKGQKNDLPVMTSTPLAQASMEPVAVSLQSAPKAAKKVKK